MAGEDESFAAKPLEPGRLSSFAWTMVCDGLRKSLSDSELRFARPAGVPHFEGETDEYCAAWPSDGWKRSVGKWLPARELLPAGWKICDTSGERNSRSLRSFPHSGRHSEDGNVNMRSLQLIAEQTQALFLAGSGPWLLEVTARRKSHAETRRRGEEDKVRGRRGDKENGVDGWVVRVNVGRNG